LTLRVLPGRYAVCRLSAGANVPTWATGELVSVTRTPDELSIVCREDGVPSGAHSERGWRCLRVVGTLDFELVGLLAALLLPLAEAGVSVFALSTFDTDCLLVREADLTRAVGALQSAGHVIGEGPAAAPDR